MNKALNNIETSNKTKTPNKKLSKQEFNTSLQAGA